LPDVADLLKTLKNQFDEVVVTVACGLFLLFEHWGWIPTLPTWLLGLAWFGFLLFGSVLAVKLVTLFVVLLQVLVLWIRRRVR
jgi:hypothetical protein